MILRLENPGSTGSFQGSHRILESSAETRCDHLFSHPKCLRMRTWKTGALAYEGASRSSPQRFEFVTMALRNARSKHRGEVPWLLFLEICFHFWCGVSAAVFPKCSLDLSWGAAPEGFMQACLIPRIHRGKRLDFNIGTDARLKTPGSSAIWAVAVKG